MVNFGLTVKYCTTQEPTLLVENKVVVSNGVGQYVLGMKVVPGMMVIGFISSNIAIATESYWS